MAYDLFTKAIEEAEKNLPEAFSIIPVEMRKYHANMIVMLAYNRAVYHHEQGILDIAKLAKFLTIAYVSSATAEEIVRVHVLKI